MTQKTLREELTNKLKVWAASKNPQIPIAVENVDDLDIKTRATAAKTAWIQVYLIPARTVNYTVSASRKTLTGFFQVNLYAPMNKGTAYSETLAQEIIDLFPVVPKTGTVSIEQTGSIMNASFDSQWRLVPVRFEYRQEDY